ncbi:Retrovirus-related Pol polyprotein from transposon [Ceratobasidium sp. AG-Ba]|nr:Retrovirus-related Pol polyprotein from transposon [Ceratobasidium sp. AG-Ba]
MNSSSGSAPQLSGNAATSVTASPHSAIRDAMMLVQKLGPFADGNSPMPEAKYRHHFKQYTFGLTDEEVARVWINNIEYASPAHMWYRTVTNTPDKAKALATWSALEAEIEKRWPTPQWDDEAHKTAMRDSWDNHHFDITTNMLARLKDRSNMTKPHQVWAEEHRALGKAVNSTDEDRVSKTISELPPWLVNLLPKGDRYGERFDELMNDIGTLSSRQLVYAYERDSAYESLASQLGHTSISQSSSFHIATPQTPVSTPNTRSYTPRPTPRRSTLRFNSAVQQTIIPLNDTPRQRPLAPSHCLRSETTHRTRQLLHQPADTGGTPFVGLFESLSFTSPCPTPGRDPRRRLTSGCRRIQHSRYRVALTEPA